MVNTKRIAVFKLLKRFSVWLPPYLIFFVFTILTLTVSFTIYRLSESEQKMIINFATEDAVGEISSQFDNYTDLLFHVRSFFDASEKVERDEFDHYVNELDLRRRYPGISGIGFSPLVKKNKISQLIAEMKTAGIKNFHIWPQQDTENFLPVMYYNSQISENSKILGYDIVSGSHQREAADLARNLNEVVISHASTLHEDINANNEKSILIFVPLFEKDKLIATAEQRRSAHIGYIFAILKTKTLFNHLTERLKKNKSYKSIEIFDSSTEDKSLYHDAIASQNSSYFLNLSNKTYSQTVPINLGQNDWLVRLTLVPDGVDAGLKLPIHWMVLFFGLIISFLIYLVMWFSRRQSEILSADLTARTRAEEIIKLAKEEAEKANLAKSQFLANMSHEIRTPLGVILGYSELALERVEAKSELSNAIEKIKKNALLLTNIIGDILDISKIEAKVTTTDIKKTNLNNIMKEVLNLHKTKAVEKDLELLLNVDPHVPLSIATDATKLKQILSNLIGNAIKFTDKGSVKITLRPIEKPIKDQPVTLEFLVEDTGVGISAEDHEKLFKSFSQINPTLSRKYGGTGLGLFLSQELAHLLGGDLKLVNSILGKGSVFKLTVPSAEFDGEFFQTQPALAAVNGRKGEQPKAGLSESELKKLTDKKVLLVEDSIDNQMLVMKLLLSANMNVDLAENGAVAIEKALKDSYDIILMDIQMPVLDGYQAAEKLRKEGFQKPIVAFTAHAFTEEKSRALKLGFDAYLTKPFSKAKLFETMISVLN